MSIKAQKQLETLATVLKSDANEKVYDRLLTQAKKLLGETFLQLVDQGDFPEKACLVEEVKRTLSELETLLSLPVLQGRSVIAVMGDTQQERLSFMKEVLGITWQVETLNYNDAIPTFFYAHDVEEMVFYNCFDTPQYINDQALKTIFRDFIYYKQMDLRPLITCLLHGGQQMYQNITFLYLPKHGVKQNEAYKNLAYMADAVIVLGKDEKDVEYNRNYLKDIQYNKHVVQYKGNQNELHQILNHYNRHCENINFIEQLQYLIGELKTFYVAKIESNQVLAKKITQNLLLWEGDDTEALGRIKMRLNQTVAQDKRHLAEIERFEIQAHKFTREIETYIKTHLSFGTAMLPYKQALLYRNGLMSLALGDMERVEQTIAVLRKQDYPKVAILSMELAIARGELPQQEDIQYLKNIISKDRDILKAQIALRSKIGLSTQKAAELCMKLGYLTTGEEFYLAGTVYQKAKKNLEAIKYYKYAVQRGYQLAGKQILKIYAEQNVFDEQEMKFLGEYMIPQANYELAKYYQREKRYKKANFYLRLAAIYEYVPAIQELADYYSYQEDMADKQKAIGIYLYALSKGANKEIVSGKIGHLYYILKEYNKAFEYLSKAQDAQSYYNLAKIYDYGNGRMQDWEKAKVYYQKAMDMGHQGARSNYHKLRARLDEKKQKQAATTTYQSTSSYSSSSYSSSSDSGWCFITTATCKALGKMDDCEEIMAFKAYRDEWLVQQADGEALIYEYYRIAPGIVAKIDQQADCSKIYEMLWENHIEKIHDNIKHKEYEVAKQAYVAMVRELQQL